MPLKCVPLEVKIISGGQITATVNYLLKLFKIRWYWKIHRQILSIQILHYEIPITKFGDWYLHHVFLSRLPTTLLRVYNFWCLLPSRLSNHMVQDNTQDTQGSKLRDAKTGITVLASPPCNGLLSAVLCTTK